MEYYFSVQRIKYYEWLPGFVLVLMTVLEWTAWDTCSLDGAPHKWSMVLTRRFKVAIAPICVVLNSARLHWSPET